MLCTGLAILGLCFPLPGHTRVETEAAGWIFRAEEGNHWWTSRWFAAGTYRVLVGVVGQKDRVEAVSIAEPRSDNPLLDPLLDKHCSKTGKRPWRSCRLSGRGLSIMPCFGGWLIIAEGVEHRDLKLQECEKFSPLFEEVLNEKKEVR